MQPRLFRQRLLELAAEYESLHAGAQAERPSDGGVPASPRGSRGSARLSGSGASRSWSTDLAGLEQPPSLVQDEPPSLVLVRQASFESLRDPQKEEEQELESPKKGRDGVATAEGGTDFDEELSRALTSIRKSNGLRRSDSRLSVQAPDTDPLARFVNSPYFTVAFGSLIVSSALLIGIETHVFSSLSYQTSDLSHVSQVFSVLNYLVTLLFTIELLARVYVFRLSFVVIDRWWNLFDSVIVLLALVEVALELVVYWSSDAQQNLFENSGTARVLRLMRLTRLLRLLRTFRQLKPLRMLVRSIAAAGRSVFWALLLLIMIMFSFGVVLTQAVTEHTEGGTRIEDENLVLYYGNLYRSMVSLWMAVSGGISWIELTDPLDGTGNSLWMWMFLVYILIVYFFILNVVTGVFCQNAIEGAAADAADLERTLESQTRDEQVHVERLALLFHEMNADTEDQDFELSLDELQILLTKARVQSWFRSLDIDATQAWKLFKIIDADNSGTVTLEEFVGGCLQLRGPATRVDVESLKWEIRHAEEERNKMLGGMLQRSRSRHALPSDEDE